MCLIFAKQHIFCCRSRESLGNQAWFGIGHFGLLPQRTLPRSFHCDHTAPSECLGCRGWTTARIRHRELAAISRLTLKNQHGKQTMKTSPLRTIKRLSLTSLLFIFGCLGPLEVNAARILFMVDSVQADGTANNPNDREVVDRLTSKGHVV